MGILVARHMPAYDAPGADHTYVECGGGGKAWGCFGRKKGGALLRTGTGSSKQANEIAGSKERAGLKCYAVNGVCHQAANRILWPAEVRVQGARGYLLSEAIYGPFGRVGFWPCYSPFERHEDVTGDLPECSGTAMALEGAMEIASDADYLQRAMQLYLRYQDRADKFTQHLMEMQVELHVELFMLLVEHQLGTRGKSDASGKLRRIRGDEERRRIAIEQDFFDGKLPTESFAKEIEALDFEFQKGVGEVLDEKDYAALLGTLKRDLVRLAELSLLKEEYGERPRR